MPRVSKQYEDKYLLKLVNHIGQMLRFYREEANLSQNKLAKMSGVSISTINEIENRVVNDIRLSTISTLGKHLGIDPLKLLVPGNLELSEDDKKNFRLAFNLLDRIQRKL
ncbi:MAG: helix-turn-helix domain-containing protein [Bacteriovoracia bacterium]